ncbi:MAG TPA: hypothetical protein VGQ44_17360 [Gemmatimonadaceae bacterium]|nr:hypothetical protein [Gemmatimonadaceae bacterium]
MVKIDMGQVSGKRNRWRCGRRAASREHVTNRSRELFDRLLFIEPHAAAVEHEVQLFHGGADVPRASSLGCAVARFA